MKVIWPLLLLCMWVDVTVKRHMVCNSGLWMSSWMVDAVSADGVGADVPHGRLASRPRPNAASVQEGAPTWISDFEAHAQDMLRDLPEHIASRYLSDLTS